MEKTLSVPVVIIKTETPIIIAPENRTETKLNLKKNSEAENVFDDLGEMEDLYEIYGEMSSTL